MKTLLSHAPRLGLAFGVALAAGLLAGCEVPPQKSEQSGYRGTGMAQITSPETLEKIAAANGIPRSAA